VGRRYLLTNLAASGGQRSIIVPKSIQSADSVDHESDVSYEFASGSAFVGLRHSLTVDATFIVTLSKINVISAVTLNTLGNAADTDTVTPPYRIEWSYTTAGGVARKHWTTFDVCRAPLKHSVTIESIRAAWPDVIWDEWVQQRGSDFAPQIADAFARLQFDVRMAGYDPDMVTDPEIADRLTMLATRALISRALEKGDAQSYEDDYRNAFEKAIGTGLKAWMQTGNSGAITSNPAVQLWLDR
jgi:hypothetical protein